MKFNKFFLTFVVFLSLSKISTANIKNNIIIKVENEIITNYEIKNKILTSLVLANKEINQQNINSLKSQSLEALIQFKLKKIELSKFNLNNDPIRTKDYLNKISSNNIENLKEKFKKNNLNYDLFLDEINTQLKWQGYIFKIYSNKIEFDESIISNELNDIIKNESNIEEYELSEIEILLDEQKSTDQEIDRIKKLIDEKGFEETALSSSSSDSAVNKGYIGWINGKSLSINIYKQIKEMKVGEISKPIFKTNSALLLKLINKKTYKSNNTNLDEHKKNLINQRKNELFNLYSKSHLSKLRNTSLIEYK